MFDTCKSHCACETSGSKVIAVVMTFDCMELKYNVTKNGIIEVSKLQEQREVWAVC